jgi:galactonate dehydratase
MKVSEVRAFPVQIPREGPHRGPQGADSESAAGGRYFRRPHYRGFYARDVETLLVKITTDDGTVGWGEGQSPIGPEVVQKALEILVAPFLVGQDPFDLDVLWHRGYDGVRERGHTKSFALTALGACNIALWDILGQATGKPVWALLGGAYRDRVPCYVSGLQGPTIPERAAFAREWKERGFGAVKLFLGYGIEVDVANVAAVREAVGDEVKILVDAHWNYDVPDAIRLGRALERLGVWVLEAPTIPEDVPGQVEIARALDMAVSAGEECQTRFEFRERLTSRAADALQPDVGRCGLSEARRIADMAAAFGIPVAPHCGTGLGIYAAASLHLAATLHNFLTLEFPPAMLAPSREIIPGTLEPESGAFALPTAPGLGVTVDEEALSQFTA